MHITGIIAAGGSGQRLGQTGGKQLLELAGRPVAAWATDALAASPLIDDLVIVCDPDRVSEYATALTATLTTEKPLTFVAGGSTRADSVRAGLAAAAAATIVAVHDGARPLLDPATATAAIEALLAASPETAGVVVGHPAIDTLKRVDALHHVIETPNRADFWVAQTPQIFRRAALQDAYDQALEDGFDGTDDAAFIEHAGKTVVMHAGGRNNSKITVSEDLDLVEHLLL